MITVTRLEELLTNILRLNVGVNQVTFIMKILETEQSLLGDDLDEGPRYSMLLVTFYQRQQILAKRLEYDADMGGLGSLVRKGVEKGDNVLAAWMSG